MCDLVPEVVVAVDDHGQPIDVSTECRGVGRFVVVRPTPADGCAGRATGSLSSPMAVIGFRLGVDGTSGGSFGCWVVEIAPGDMQFSPIRGWHRRSDSTSRGVVATVMVPGGRGR